MMMENYYYDGKTSKRHIVELALLDNGLQISDLAFWPRSHILIVEEKPLRLMLIDQQARLEVRNEVLAQSLISTYDLKKRSVQHERKKSSKILMISGLALASTLLFLIFGLPFLSRAFAPIVPASAEVKLGEAIDKEIKNVIGDGKEFNTCSNEAGVKALDKLMSILESNAGLHTKLKVKMFDTRQINAFATAGGHIYLLDGLLQRAESPDQFAGVIAHEIGHLYHRHVLQNFIEVGGVSLLLGQIFGDFTGSTAILYATKSLISSAHSREFERESDRFGVALMNKVKGDPRALATMLEKIDPSRKGENTSPFGEWLRSHPLTEGRAAEIRKNAGDIEMRAPILSGQEWLDLKEICKKSITPQEKPATRT